MTAPASSCLWCGPAPARRFWSGPVKAGQITAWYQCKACKCRWLVSWLTSALGEAA